MCIYKYPYPIAIYIQVYMYATLPFKIKIIKKRQFFRPSNMFFTMSKTSKHTNIFLSVNLSIIFIWLNKQKILKIIRITSKQQVTYIYFFFSVCKKAIQKSRQVSQWDTHIQYLPLAFSPILQVRSSRTEITSHQIFPNMKFKFLKEKSMLFQKAKSANTIFFILPCDLL